MKKNMIVLCVLAAAFMPACAYATGTAAAGGGFSSIILLVALFAIMYFLMIRPQQKKEKETANMRNNLKVGDDIVTIGGIYGKIVRIKDDRITIAVGAAQTKLEIAKWAISGLDKPAEITAKKAGKSEAEEGKKPTPKTIKKLGAKKEEEQTFLEEQKEAETTSEE